MDTPKPKELWNCLQNEPERAFQAFQTFLALPFGERTVVSAYKIYTGNPDAKKVSDTWTRWSSQFAWRERAAAHDGHLASIRRGAYERAIEQEAERQAQAVERMRHRMYELLTLAYERAVECLQDQNWASSNLRTSDVISIIRLHMEANEKFGTTTQYGSEDSNWNEEDDQQFDEILKEVIEAEQDPENLKQGLGEDSDSDHPEKGS